MRRLLVLLLLSNLLAIAATNYTIPLVIGWPSASVSQNPNTFALSTASNAAWFAVSYIPPNNITLQNVSINVSTVTGTLASTDMEVDVYSATLSSSSFSPNASLATSTTSSQQTVGFIKFGGTGTGYNYALTANTAYFFVLKNNNASPTSNYPTVSYSSSGTPIPGFYLQNCLRGSWYIATTVNSGSSWSGVTTSIPFIRLDFTDGSSAGMPYTNNSKDTTNVVKSTAEVGNMFVTQGVQLNVAGIASMIGESTTPTGSARYGLWTCNVGAGTCTNLGYTNTASETLTGGTPLNIPLDFATPITLPPYTTVIVTLGETTNSDTTKYYELGTLWTVDNNTTCTGASATKCSTQLIQFGAVGAYCTSGCTTYSNWTQTAASFYGIQLLLSSFGEFSPIPVSSPIAQ